MFLLYLLGCWTSVQFNFLSVLVVFVVKFVVVLLLVVQGGTMCLPMTPSWPEVPASFLVPGGLLLQSHSLLGPPLIYVHRSSFTLVSSILTRAEWSPSLPLSHASQAPVKAQCGCPRDSAPRRPHPVRRPFLKNRLRSLSWEQGGASRGTRIFTLSLIHI